MRSFFYFIVLTMLFGLGCAGTIQETITCDPPQADIYWGKTISDLAKTGHKTPYTRSASGSNWEPWCYQVRKDGYQDSEVICREEDSFRYLDFSLVPLKTTITSEPPNAVIYWGPSKDQIQRTIHITPKILTVKDVSSGASWKDWFYQVKKNGFYDSEIIFLPRQLEDRYARFDLEPFKLQVSEYPVPSDRVRLTWEDRYSNELGYKIERKKELRGSYKEIARVGPNVTSYTDSGLNKGIVYYYRVRAYSSVAHSAYSEEMRVKISAD